MPRVKGSGKQTVATSLRLSPLCVRLWEELAARAGLNRTAYFETTIRRLAQEHAVEDPHTESDGEQNGTPN